MITKPLLLFVAVITLFLSGCASIVSKSKYPVNVDSEPRGARVIITDKNGAEVLKARTPAAVKLNAGAGYFAKASYTIKVTKEGYQDVTIPVEFKLNGWYFGNLLLGGVIGLLIVDPITGAMWRLKGQDYHSVDLTADGKTAKGACFRVKLLEQTTPDERTAMVKIQ